VLRPGIAFAVCLAVTVLIGRRLGIESDLRTLIGAGPAVCGASAIGLPGGQYEIPLVIQDRQFNPDGTFRYPVSTIPGITWIGEYCGDHMLVNGKVWPYLDVEPRLYRFRVLNGCNARIMSLDMGGAPMWQIGAEGGMWDRPVPMRQMQSFIVVP
jgi:FtsP/CotA-like multicopper oxidase with cupredoxin domain